MNPTKIENEELLYRSARADGSDYTNTCGCLQVSSSAFNDRENKPSVDRSSLRTNPIEVKKSATDKVIALLTAEVRNITDVKVSGDEKDLRTHAVDALHRPILTDPKNIAHSQIECDPEFENKSRFKKLKEALARLASKSGFVAEERPQEDEPRST
jgi:hypothetical protein